jgi:NAD(P)-dependent dehydrogenase (short-subunit alcohol dehydrogenase family)
MDMTGKVAFVTGAGSGIGRASASLFAKRGASVLVCDINDAAARETADLITTADGHAVARLLDVRDPSSVESAVAFAISELGGLDFAHNNAGISGLPRLLENTSLEEFDDVLRTNLYGIFYCMKFQLPHMKANGKGAIVNTASTAGLGASPFLPAYTASKHGVVGLSRTAAVDYARHGVRINVLCPGTTLTPMLQALADRDPESKAMLEGASPMGRLGSVEELAAAAVFLCSEGAAYINGIVLPVDGGMTALSGTGSAKE